MNDPTLPHPDILSSIDHGHPLQVNGSWESLRTTPTEGAHAQVVMTTVIPKSRLAHVSAFECAYFA